MWRTLLAQALRGIAVEAVKRYAPWAHAWLREKAQGLAIGAYAKMRVKADRLKDRAIERYQKFVDAERNRVPAVEKSK